MAKSKEEKEAEAKAKAEAEAQTKAEAEAKAKAEAEAKAAAKKGESKPIEAFSGPSEDEKREAARRMPKHGLAAYDYRYGRACTFVDNDGQEYDARILPMPVNKGEVVEIPAIMSPTAEMAKIEALPATQRAKAMLAFQRRLGETVPALELNGEVRQLARYQDLLCWTTPVGNTLVPCANLMVNFARKTGGENWQPRNRVRPREFVPHGLPTGVVSHFVLKPE